MSPLRPSSVFCRIRFAASLRLLWLLFTAGAGLVRAHDPGLSTSQIHLAADRLEVELALAPNDLRALLPPGAVPPGSFDSAAVFAAAEPTLQEIAPLLCHVQSGGAVLPPSAIHTTLSPGDKVTLNYVFAVPGTANYIYTFGAFASLPAGHRNYTTVHATDDALLQEKMLQRDDPAVTFAPPSTVSPSVVAEPTFSFREFLVLGVEHIWTGYDHLLFLFGLLLVCRTLRSVAAIITCFTLAHSLTLAVATLGWLDLSARFVEPAIAASIVFVGVENLLRGGDEPRWRWALTFAFGLIHGFGFASVLRELGVGAAGHGLAAPLFTFNLGVELGQLAVAVAVLQLLHRLRRHDLFLRRAVPALSALVALAGGYWFLERTFLGG
jgi:hydrogenase/urease accessory protein HupE